MMTKTDEAFSREIEKAEKYFNERWGSEGGKVPEGFIAFLTGWVCENYSLTKRRRK